MANTQHTLQLRAQLDTTQVRQELQKLRQQQQAALGGQKQHGINAPANNTTNIANLNSLSTAMTRLAQMIQHLDHTMSQMNNMTKTSVNQSRQSGSPIAMSLGGSVASNIGKSLEAYNDKALRTFLGNIRGMGDKTQVREIAKTLWTENSRVGQLIRQKFGIDDTQQFSAQLAAKRAQEISFKTLNRQFGSIASFANSRPGLDYINYDPYKAERKAEALNNHRIMKFMGGMILNQAAGSAADYYEATGNVGIAGGIRAASKVGSYALMGASIGGVYGAGAGAVAGAIESLFDTITAKARETQERIGREWDVKSKLGEGTVEWKKSLTNYRKSKRFTDLIDQFSEDYQTSPLEVEYGRLAKRKDFVQQRLDVYQKMSEQGFLGEADLKAANDLKNELSDLDNKMKTITNTLKNFRKAFEKTIEADEYSRKTRQMFKTGSLLDIQGELTTLREFRDKAKAAGNIEDFTKYSSRIRQLEQREELIQETQRSSALELGRMDESYQNSRILERYGIGGGLGVRSTMMDYAKAAVSERSRYEQLMSEGRLEEAAKAKASWQFAAGERNTLADQLLQVLGNKTADLTNVTSLASIGANMGEVNDNFDRQMAIWEDQRNLQRDIKNILNEKEFVAHYGE